MNDTATMHLTRDSTGILPFEARMIPTFKEVSIMDEFWYVDTMYLVVIIDCIMMLTTFYCVASISYSYLLNIL